FEDDAVEGEKVYRCYLASGLFRDRTNVLAIKSSCIGGPPMLFVSPREKKLVCLVDTKTPEKLIAGAEIYIYDWTKGREATRWLDLKRPIFGSMSAMIQESFCLALVDDRRSVVIY